MKIWVKLFKDNHLLKDYVAEDMTDDTRTHKIFHSMDEACHYFDLQNPIWLDANVRDFKKIKKTRFKKENFIEEIDFDYMEFQLLEE